MPLLDDARALADDLVALRRDLHRHPELGFRETRTAGIVARLMEGLGCSVRTGVARTGVVADLENGPGPVVALRADMDALPITEVAGRDYGSTAPGVMHACGHDAHVAGLVGAARLLARARDDGRLPSGTVRLLFQPSEEGFDEEGMSGAMRFVEEDVLDGVDAVVGLHVGGHLPAGKLFVSEGTIMAGSEELRVDVRGTGSHAAHPEQGVDALVLAAQGVLAAQTAVARRISPMDAGVVTFGVIEGGTAPNVVADRVRLHGTLRYFREEVRERLAEAVTGAFRGLEAQGAGVDVRVGPGYLPVVNDRRVADAVRRAAEDVLGADAVLAMDRWMGAEDFAFLARAAPGCFVWLGAAPAEPREHHHPAFDIDEAVLPLGAAVLAASAERLLQDAVSGDER